MKRLGELDILRALAMIMVVIIHVTAAPIIELVNPTITHSLSYLNWVSKPSVPIFLFASGLGLTYVYQYKELVLNQFYKKRLPKILIPYVLWSAFYFWLGHQRSIGNLLSTDFLYSLRDGSSSYHLYFLVILLEFYIFFPLLRRFCQWKEGKAVLIVIVCYGFYLWYVPFKVENTYSLMTYIGFCFLGCYAGLYYRKFLFFVQKKTKIFWIGLSLYMAYLLSEANLYWQENPSIVDSGFFAKSGYYYYCIFAILAFYSISLFLEVRRERDKRFYRILDCIGRGSFVIYLVHPLILYTVAKILEKLGETGVLKVMVVQFLATFILLVPVSSGYYKLKKIIKEKCNDKRRRKCI